MEKWDIFGFFVYNIFTSNELVQFTYFSLTYSKSRAFIILYERIISLTPQVINLDLFKCKSLFLGIHQNNKEIVSFLSEKVSLIELSICICKAIECNNVEMLRFLIEKGAHPRYFSMDPSLLSLNFIKRYKTLIQLVASVEINEILTTML